MDRPDEEAILVTVNNSILGQTSAIVSGQFDVFCVQILQVVREIPIIMSVLAEKRM